MIFIILITLIILPFGSFANNSLASVNFSKPDNVVSNAIQYLMNKNFSNLLELTEFSEKRRVEKIIEAYLTEKNLIDTEILNIQSYKILNTYYEGEFAVVSVEWVVKNKYQTREGPKTYNANRRVLYLLKKFDDKWKIITKRVET
ncbi:MAG: hypothetical protein RMJ37_05205 [Spirochaetia bacterium]|nr:hypothetical protein [Spirochaetota bacterium]MCX8096409.1 hypothetical protein [Spirochaetota bacterium]MDW8112716.1 hypothetical protein [Spirochaetia bacterium]